VLLIVFKVLSKRYYKSFSTLANTVKKIYTFGRHSQSEKHTMDRC